MSKLTDEAADLFSGAGGTSTGVLLAADELGIPLNLLAINHWNVAVATHMKNHPQVKHLCAELDDISPRKVVPGKRLRLLTASPECIFHSNARGGGEADEQSRAGARHVSHWAEMLNVENILIENVREFMKWGPLDAEGYPVKKLEGRLFLNFIDNLHALGYKVDYRVLNYADSGDPTTRQRLFIMARKGHRIKWPDPTHSKDGGSDMFRSTEKWRAAREIIDFSKPGESIFTRKIPLKPNTLKRIVAGLRKYSGLPLVLGQQSQARPRDLSQPLPTVAGAGAISMIQPFLIQMDFHGFVQSIYDPLNTVTGADARGLVEPFLVEMNGTDAKRLDRSAKSLDQPLGTVVGAPTFGLVNPFLVMLNGTRAEQLEQSNRSIDDPLPTVTGQPHFGLVEPYIVATNHGDDDGRVYPVDQPLPTITSVDAWGVVEPFLVRYLGSPDRGQIRTQSVGDPLQTVTTENQFGLVQPFLVSFYSNGHEHSLAEPLPTQSTIDRFGLVEPWVFKDNLGQLYILDIRFRMLQPHELALAMGFPKEYEFTGTRREQVKQIGNAVPCNTAKALAMALLS